MERKKSRYFTLMIMPESSALEVKRLRVSRRFVQGSAVGLGAMILVAMGAVLQAAHLWGGSEEAERLRAENNALRSELEALDDRLQSVDAIVLRLKAFDAKLRAMTLVSDPERSLAIGPVGAPPESVERPGAAAELRHDLLADSAEHSADLVRSRVEFVAADASGTEARIAGLSAFLEGQRALLATIPSRRPANGYVSSTFGMRVDPFTGLSQMHSGIDFSANIGARVVSTADGVVILSSQNAAYGLMIEVDHGNGLVTRYAHLSKSDVKVGQSVKRGETIGAVGNTGRSTGPHLHYEVRLAGMPQDPERFLLE